MWKLVPICGYQLELAHAKKDTIDSLGWLGAAPGKLHKLRPLQALSPVARINTQGSVMVNCILSCKAVFVDWTVRVFPEETGNPKNEGG